MLTRARILSLFIAFTGLAVLCSCSSDSKTDLPDSAATKDNASPNTAADAPLIPAGELMDDHIFFEFAVYYLPKPSSDPVAVLDELLASKSKAFKKVEKLGEKPEQMLVSARLNSDVQKTYAPPDLDSLQYFGRGLSREQAVALQDSKTVLILDFAHPKEHVWEGLRAACELISSLARQTDGLIWDEITREVFTPDRWDEKRLEPWTEQFPAIADHTTVHA